MNSISKNQLAALLLITDIFGLFCGRGSISLMTLWGFLAGTAVQLALLLLFALRNGKLRRWAEFLYLIYAVFCGGTLFSSLWQTGSAVYIPYVNGIGIWGRLITAGLIAIVCLYSSSTGIKPVARAAVIAAAIGTLCIFIDFVSAAFTAEWSNAVLPQKQSFLTEFVRSFAYSGGTGSLAALLGDVRGSRVRTVITYSLAKAVFTAMILLTVLTVAGGIMPLTEFPMITAAQLSQPFASQRLDSVFLVVFAVFAVFAVTPQVMTGAFLLKKLFPRFERWRSTAVISLIIVSALLISGHELLSVRAFAAAAALIIAPLGVKKSADKVLNNCKT